MVGVTSIIVLSKACIKPRALSRIPFGGVFGSVSIVCCNVLIPFIECLFKGSVFKNVGTGLVVEKSLSVENNGLSVAGGVCGGGEKGFDSGTGKNGTCFVSIIGCCILVSFYECLPIFKNGGTGLFEKLLSVENNGLSAAGCGVCDNSEKCFERDSGTGANSTRFVPVGFLL